MEYLPAPLCYHAHVTNYPRKEEDNVVNLGTIMQPGPFVVCTRDVLLTAASLPLVVCPAQESAEDYKARFEINGQLLVQWARDKGLVLYPDQVAARASMGEFPLDLDRGDLGPWVTIVNPEEYLYRRCLYRFEFGGAGSTHLVVWSDSFDDALETAAEWLCEHAPGHIMTRDSLEARIEDAPHATEDLMCTESGYLSSSECVGTKSDSDLLARVTEICQQLHPEEDDEEDDDDTVRWDA